VSAEGITAIAAVIGASSGLAGVFVAWAGLRTWRAQLRGNTEYDLARRVLRGVFKVRDALQSVRNPFISSGEFLLAAREAGRDPNSSSAFSDPLSQELVYDRRWKAVAAAQAELQIELLEAEVLWGAPIRDLDLQLRKPVAELYVAMVQYLRALSSPPHPGSRHEELIEKRIVTLNFAGEADDFTTTINHAVDGFQTFLKPRLHITQV